MDGVCFYVMAFWTGEIAHLFSVRSVSASEAVQDFPWPLSSPLLGGPGYPPFPSSTIGTHGYLFGSFFSSLSDSVVFPFGVFPVHVFPWCWVFGAKDCSVFDLCFTSFPLSGFVALRNHSKALV